MSIYAYIHAEGFLVCTRCGKTGKPLVNQSLNVLDSCECGGVLEGFKINELPVVVVDDDFYEYLEEESVDGSLESVEFAEYWVEWALENVEPFYLEHQNYGFNKMHDMKKCAGQFCTIHNRSDHSMRSFPQVYRWDKALMERICPHGIGHPDPDEINPDTVHGCEGCCYDKRKGK